MKPASGAWPACVQPAGGDRGSCGAGAGAGRPGGWACGAACFPGCHCRIACPAPQRRPLIHPPTHPPSPRVQAPAAADCAGAARHRPLFVQQAAAPGGRGLHVCIQVGGWVGGWVGGSGIRCCHQLPSSNRPVYRSHEHAAGMHSASPACCCSQQPGITCPTAAVPPQSPTVAAAPAPAARLSAEWWL